MYAILTILLSAALAGPKPPLGLQHPAADALLVCAAKSDDQQPACFEHVFNESRDLVLDGAPPTQLQLDLFACQTTQKTPSARQNCFNRLAGMISLVRSDNGPNSYLQSAPLRETEAAFTELYKWTFAEHSQIVSAQTSKNTETTEVRELAVQDCVLGYVQRIDNQNHERNLLTARVALHTVVPLAGLSITRSETDHFSGLLLHSEQKRIFKAQYSFIVHFHEEDDFPMPICMPDQIRWTVAPGRLGATCEPGLWVNEDGSHNLMAPTEKMAGSWDSVGLLPISPDHHEDITALLEHLTVLAERCSATP